MIHKNFSALTLWPFIILKEPKYLHDEGLINHERIHLRQQTEMLILPFYIWYFIEWVIKSSLLGSFYKGYKAISFEQEAYGNESNSNYLNVRGSYNFTPYIFKL